MRSPICCLAIMVCVARISAQAICVSGESWCTFLKKQDSLGLAAGNAGDYYQNADSSHANAGNATCPQVTLLPLTRGAVYTTDSTKVIVGNASLAYTTLPGAVSLIRYGMLSQSGANSIYRQYTHNNAYWYPEHQDHDTGSGGGDRFHAMTPCATNSQGSSGSELDEVRKFLWTLAAFRPATKTALKNAGLLMPTIQMIMRRTRAASDAEYLSGAVHWNAYDDFNNSLAMVTLANEILPDRVPPMVKLRVVDDSYRAPLALQVSSMQSLQRWYAVPSSICRVWRDFAYTHEITVSADSSYDVNNRALTYHWRVLRGDTSRVRIVPVAPNYSTVRIEFDYQNGDTIPGTRLYSSIVIVGAFVNNGAYYSAPAFITSYSMANQVRRYDIVRGAPIDVSYQDYYLLESLEYNKSWQRDTFYCYPGTPVVSGWKRFMGASTFEFAANGYIVSARDAAGHVTRAQAIYYMSMDTLSRNRLVWRASGAVADFDGAPPSAPANVTTASLTNSAIRVSWNASLDSTIAPAIMSGVAGYRVEVSTDNTFSSVLKRWNVRDVGDSTSVTIDGLALGTRYYIRIRAYDRNQNLSPPSTAVNAQTSSGIVSRYLSKTRLAPMFRIHADRRMFEFEGLPQGSAVMVIDLAGRISRATAIQGSAQMRMKNARAERAAGIYLYRITLPAGETVEGTIQVTR